MKFFSGIKLNQARLFLVAPIILFIGAITVIVIFQAFRDVNLADVWQLLINPGFQESLMFSLWVALISVVISGFLAIITAYGLSLIASKTLTQLGEALLKIPLVLSFTGAGVVIFNVYSPNGFLAQLLGHELGYSLIFDQWGIGVILLNVFKGFPFIALSLLPLFVKCHKNYLAVATHLGANTWNYLSHILLPYASKGILSVSLVMFNANVFAYESFYFLGPSRPMGVGVMAYRQYVQGGLDYTVAMAISLVMICLSLLLVAGYFALNTPGKGGRL